MENGISEQMMTILPPSSLDAERSVLGAVLQDSGAATLAFETLMPEDFYSIDLMNAYQMLGEIIGEAVDEDLVDTIFKEFCMGK